MENKKLNLVLGSFLAVAGCKQEKPSDYPQETTQQEISGEIAEARKDARRMVECALKAPDEADFFLPSPWLQVRNYKDEPEYRERYYKGSHLDPQNSIRVTEHENGQYDLFLVDRQEDVKYKDEGANGTPESAVSRKTNLPIDQAEKKYATSIKAEADECLRLISEFEKRVKAERELVECVMQAGSNTAGLSSKTSREEGFLVEDNKPRVLSSFQEKDQRKLLYNSKKYGKVELAVSRTTRLHEGVQSTYDSVSFETTANPDRHEIVIDAWKACQEVSK